MPSRSRPVAIAVHRLATAGGRGATPKFLPDDPIASTIDSQDASQVTRREIDLVYDTLENLLTKPGDPTPNVRAQNVNTVDEVPDSSWFTNRHWRARR